MTNDSKEEQREMTMLRWFAGAKCLAEDTESGETMLVRGGIPGEVARVREFNVGRRTQRVVTSLVSQDPRRIAPACPYAARCTGCDLLHLSHADEQQVKAEILSEILGRFAHIDVEADDIEIVGADRGAHRSRAGFRVHVDTDGLRVGLGAVEGGLVHAPDCPANSEPVRETAQQVTGALTRLRAAGSDLDVTGFEIECGSDAGELSAAGNAARALILDASPESAAAIADLLSPDLSIGFRRDSVVWLRGSRPRPHGPEGLALQVADGGWTQPNHAAADALYRWVARHAAADGRRVLDLCCGNGGMSLMLAHRAEHVSGVDVHYPSVLAAQAAAAAAGLTDCTHFRGGRAETVVPRMVQAGERYDVALINPMRRSLGDGVMTGVARLGVDRVLYLGPAARAAAPDLAALVSAGYRVERVAGADLHPGTAKIMLLVVAVAT